MEHAYFKWLIESIDPKHMIGNGYQPVFEMLFDTDYRWTKRFPDDENRARDGLALRERFAEIKGVDVSEIGLSGKPCSCLEMLVALATRIEFEILSMPGDENVPKWFWRFMDGLGLLPTNPMIKDPNYVSERLNIWLDRKYERDGSGGIFVIDNHYFDMRKMTIWKQMTAVLYSTEVGENDEI